MIEQDHRFIKRLTKPALDFKSFNGAKQTITEIEISNMIKKGQLKTWVFWFDCVNSLIGC